jgi:hypothetical protein
MLADRRTAIPTTDVSTTRSSTRLIMFFPTRDLSQIRFASEGMQVSGSQDEDRLDPIIAVDGVTVCVEPTVVRSETAHGRVARVNSRVYTRIE